MKRVLVLGGAGMLGHKLCEVFSERFATFAAFRRTPPAAPRIYERVLTFSGVDALAFESVVRCFEQVRPDVVVNAIGIVRQVSEARNPVQSILVNSLFPHRLADLCRTTGSRLIHISTDCVFSGCRGDYVEDDVPDPVDLYGRSKLLGELEAERALTIRTSFIGREISSAHGLVEWFLAQAGGRVSGYARAMFSGLTTVAFARLVGDVIADHPALQGVWHVSGPPTSKYDLLVALDAAFQTRIRVERDDEPRYDRTLDSTRFWTVTKLRRPDWQTMIGELRADAFPYPRPATAR